MWVEKHDVFVMFIPTLSPCPVLSWCSLLLEPYSSSKWPCPAAVACSTADTVRAFREAWFLWNTEWAPFSLVTINILRSSNAGLPQTLFSRRFSTCIIPMQAVEIIFIGTGVSRRRLLPSNCFYFAMVPSILVCLVWAILCMCLSALQLKRAALDL